MQASRLGRIFYGLIVTISLLVIVRNVYQRWIDEQLTTAIRYGTLGDVKDRLKRHADPNYATTLGGEGRQQRRYTMLTLAFFRLIDVESGIRRAKYLLTSMNQQTVPNASSAAAMSGSLPPKTMPSLTEQAGYGLDVEALEQQRDDTEAIISALVAHRAQLVPRPGETSYLSHVCAAGNLKLLRLLLNQGIPVSQLDPKGFGMDAAIAYPRPTGMMLARRREGSRYDNSQGRNGNRPISPERRKIREEMIRLLREYGAILTASQAVALGDSVALERRIPSASREEMAQLVPVAAQSGDLDSAELLLNHGADPNVAPDGQDTALYIASDRGDIAMATLLMEHGAKVNISGQDGNLPLNTACKRGDIEMVKLLLAHGGKLNRPDQAMVPLRSAMIGNSPAMVRFLLAQGADPNIQDAMKIPLLSTALERMPDVVPDLLQRGAQLNPTIKFERTPWAGSNLLPLSPLMTAIWYAPQYEPILRQKGARIGDDARLILITAANRHRVDLFPQLLECGAEVNASDFNGDTPLSQSILYAPAGVKILLEHGANPNTTNRAKRTPLNLAAITGNVEVTRLLIEHGANVNALPERGHTALYYAKRHHHKEIIALLEKAGGILDIPPTDFPTN